MGFTISRGKLVPNAKKLDVISSFPVPKTQQELQKYLGYLTFIRTLVPLKILDLSTVLTPLTSVTKEFKWNENHNQAFQMIKEILKGSQNFEENNSRNGVKILYTDASENLLGAILFDYNLTNKKTLFLDFLQDFCIPDFSSHLDHYKIKCKLFPSINDNSIFVCFMYIILHSQRLNTNKIFTTGDINEFLNKIFSNLHILRIFFKTNEQLHEIVNLLVHQTITDDLFFKYFSELLAIASIILKKNIKILFGCGRQLKTPYFCLYEDTNDLDVCIGFDFICYTF